MGIFSKVEHRMEDAVENAGDRLFDSPISPVQIAKKCEKFMKRNKMVGAGKQFAPTLYTILVNQEDDRRLFSFYPTLAGETETYLSTAASHAGLYMDGNPLVRFVADQDLKHGKFDVFAQVVAAPIVEKLREEENLRYGLTPSRGKRSYAPAQAQPAYDTYEEEYYEEDGYYEDEYAGQAPVGYGDGLDNFADDYADDYAEDYGEYGYQPEPVQPAQPVQPETAVQRTAYFQNIISNKTYRLSKPTITIGREDNNDVVVADPGASRHHARLVKQGNTWYMEDLNSTNGTLVNGRSATKSALENGSIITIGETDYEFILQ